MRKKKSIFAIYFSYICKYLSLQSFDDQKTYNSIHDFLNDDSFKNWAFNSQLSDVSFWDFWLKNNPLKRDIAYEARDILLGINFKKDTVGEKITS